MFRKTLLVGDSLTMNSVTGPGLGAKQDPTLFNLKWRNYQAHMMSVFDKILLTESFSDVTLVLADVEHDTTHAIKAHKIMLGASSPYFEMVFSEHPCQHPVVVMPPDVKLEDLQHVLQFVYRGEVQVSEDLVIPLCDFKYFLDTVSC